MSIIPSQLQLVANQNQIEQNHTIILSARVLNEFGNPIPDQDVSLFMNHIDFLSPVLLTQQTTNARGTATFEVPLRSVGNSTLSAHCGSLSSAPINVQVLPSALPPSGPKTWYGVAGSMSRLQIDLNTLIGKMLTNGLHPTKEELCTGLGLDYSRANDRDKMSQVLYASKLSFDYVWRHLYEPSPAFGSDYSTFMNDAAGYSAWKNDPSSPYAYLRNYYHQSDDEVRRLWVLSRMWDRFVQTANQYNLHLFVGYFDTINKVWRYKQPSFWEYVEKQIWSASRLGHGMRTILGRHRDLGMVLTSGEPIQNALEGAQTVHKMIIERTTPRIKCLRCWRKGIEINLSSQDELVEHIKSNHLND